MQQPNGGLRRSNRLRRKYTENYQGALVQNDKKRRKQDLKRNLKIEPNNNTDHEQKLKDDDVPSFEAQDSVQEAEATKVSASFEARVSF